MTSKRKCSKKVWSGYSLNQCSRPATVERIGQWWCWQHDPERVAFQSEMRRKDWEVKMDREAAKYERIARDARLGALVTEETAALLERLANMVVAWGDRCIYSDDMDNARAMAARIREALRG